VVGNGTAIVPIGGGLTVTNITVSGTTPSIATLESGKHYIYNGAGASGDVTITMPAVAAESNIRVTVYNIPTTRKMSLARAGSDNFRKDDTLYTTVEFRAVEVEQSSEFVAATDAAEWLVNDGSNALGTVWSGALQVTGALTASGGIVGKTDGVAVADGYVGQTKNAQCTATTTITTSDTDTDITGMSIELTRGIWLIGYNVSAELYNNTGSTVGMFGRTRITDSSNSALANTEALIGVSNIAAGTNSIHSITRQIPIIVAATTTYKVRGAKANLGTSLAIFPSSGLISALTDPDNSSNIWAVRIA
jgi:hypothetical protein